MKELILTGREAGQRMDKYLFKVMNQAPKSFVYKMLRKKNILLNEKKASGQEILRPGDSIKVYLSDETFAKFATPLPMDSAGLPQAKEWPTRQPDAGQSPSRLAGSGKQERQGLPATERKGTPTMPKARLDIVYEDEDLLIINKPAGLLSQKAAASDDSANDRIIAYLLESGQITEGELRTFRPSICNRLDRNTAGLLIAGKTMHGLQYAAEALRDRSMKKYYHAMVWGKITTEAHQAAYLVKNHQTNQVEIFDEKPENPTGKVERIETAFRPLNHYGPATLLEIHLITGRSHQIRAHLAHLGYPLLGDYKYGKSAHDGALRRDCKIRTQLLCSYRMEWPDGRVITGREPDTFARAKAWLKHR